MTPLLYRFLHPKTPNGPTNGPTPQEPDGCARAFWIGMLFFVVLFGFLFWYFDIRK